MKAVGSLVLIDNQETSHMAGLFEGLVLLNGFRNSLKALIHGGTAEVNENHINPSLVKSRCEPKMPVGSIQI
jgi:hypothetical protein